MFEKFTKESTSLLDELALINNGSDKGTQQEKERFVIRYLQSMLLDYKVSLEIQIILKLQYALNILKCVKKFWNFITQTTKLISICVGGCSFGN